MKYRLTKISIAIASVTCASMVFAMDSTGVLPSSGGGASIQKQTTMVQGYANIYTNYASYTQQPTGMNSTPTPPQACAPGDVQLATNYAPTSAVIQGCSSWSCPTSCSSISGCADMAACYPCSVACTVFSCSCPGVSCSTNVYSWSTNFTGPSSLASITCGSTGFVSHSQDIQKGNIVSTQSSLASIQSAQLGQINALIAQIHITLNGGAGASTIASLINIANTTLSGLQDIANQALNGLESVGCAIGGLFSGGGGW